MRDGEYGDRFMLLQHWAVSIDELHSLLLRHKPHIVHFSGHGSSEGEIILEPSPRNEGNRRELNLNAQLGGVARGSGRPGHVSPRALSNTFKILKDNVRCVVLNACYTETQARAIAEHIDVVAGMSRAIGDEAAIHFASAFYLAIAFGRDIKTAFELGRIRIALENIPEHATPQLLAPRSNPEVLFLLSSQPSPAQPQAPADESPQNVTQKARVAERGVNVQIGGSNTGPINTVTGGRQGIVLDLSHNQSEWDRFTTCAQNSALQFHIIEQNILEARQLLDRSALLIIALPWRSSFKPEEVNYIEEWVLAGGGLFLLGNYAPIHHESNPNALANKFDFRFEDNLIMPGAKTTDKDSRMQARSFDADLAVKIRLTENGHHSILQGIMEVAFLSSCSIKMLANPDGKSEYILMSPVSNGVMIPEGKTDERNGFMPAINQWVLDRHAEVPVLSACQRGKGRVVVSGSLKICTLDYGDNAKLVKNILEWLSEPSQQ